MPVSLGDLTLYFRAETKDLHGSIRELGDSIKSNLGPSQRVIDELNRSLDATGDNIAYAGEEARRGMGMVQKSTRDALSEVQLLNAQFGLHLPRALMGFISRLPGVATALSAAFSATAIFFVIEALIKANQKLQEFIDKPAKIAEAWRTMGDVQIRTAKDTAMALANAASTMDGASEGTKRYASTLRAMHDDAASAASAVKAIGDELIRNLNLQAISSFNPLGWWNANSKKDADDAQKFISELTSAVERMGSLAGRAMLTAEINRIDIALKAENETLEKTKERWKNLGFEGSVTEQLMTKVSRDRIAGLREEQDQYRGLRDRMIDIGKLQLDQMGKDAETRRSELYGKRVADAKRQLEQNLANITAEEVAQESAFADSKISADKWAIAQKKAAQDATAAHLDYYRNVANIAATLGNRDQRRAAELDLATQATLAGAAAMKVMAANTREETDENLKYIKSIEDQEDAHQDVIITRARIATDEMTRSQMRLAQAQTQLNLARVNASFDKQEQNIIRMADLTVNSEVEMNRKLLELENQRRDAALAVEDQTIADLSASRDKWAAKLKAIPIFNKEDLDQTKKNLDDAETALIEAMTRRVQIAHQYDSRYFALEEAQLRRGAQSWRGFFEVMMYGQLRAGQLFKLFTTNLVQGIAASTEAAIMGSNSFAGAMAQMAKGALAALAGLAIGKVLNEVAEVFSENAKAASDLATPFFEWHAAFHFAAAHAHAMAAVKWGVIGAVAGIGGAAIPTGGGGGGGGSTAGGAGTPFQAPIQPEQNPVQRQNVFSFAAGALVTRPTAAIVGHGREEIIPIDDDRATDPLAAKLVAKMGGTGTTINLRIEGMISPDNLRKVVSQISRDVNAGRVHLLSSDSKRYTRRS